VSFTFYRGIVVFFSLVLKWKLHIRFYCSSLAGSEMETPHCPSYKPHSIAILAESIIHYRMWFELGRGYGWGGLEIPIQERKGIIHFYCSSLAGSEMETPHCPSYKPYFIATLAESIIHYRMWFELGRGYGWGGLEIPIQERKGIIHIIEYLIYINTYNNY
jgi:hypothetical protein